MAPDLAATLIRDYSQPGDVVFDPLAGTGTTLVEAIHAGRNAMGVGQARAAARLAHPSNMSPTG